MKRILILGGGFIGANIAKMLVEYGYFVKILSRTNPNIPHVVFKRFDWRNITNESSFFEDIDIVIHTICTSVPLSSYNDIKRDIQDNILLNIDLIEILKFQHIKKTIFISSGGAIYGNIDPTCGTKESFSTNPISPYGISKLATEKYFQMHDELTNSHTIILRPSNIYGVGQRISKPQGVIGHMINLHKSNEVFKIWGDGKGKKDYLHINDFVDAITKIVELDSFERNIYNVSSHELYSVNELVAMVNDISGKELQVDYIEESKVDVKAVNLDSSKFRDQFDWKPKTTIYEGLKELIHYEA